MVDAISSSWNSWLNSASSTGNSSSTSTSNSASGSAAASSTSGSSGTTDSTTTSTSSKNALDKDAFLQLMVAELGNQDPLDPMDNTEFVSQLAQFSALEQMQNVASAMELMALTQTAATNSQMVNLIGKRVIAPGSTVTWDGTNAASIRFDLTATTTAAEVVVYDSNGKAVRHIAASNLKTGVNNVAFDGLDDDGNTLAAGNYTYKVLDNSGEAISDITTYGNYLIDAVAYDDSGTLLKSYNDSIELADVSEVIKN